MSEYTGKTYQYIVTKRTAMSKESGVERRVKGGERGAEWDSASHLENWRSNENGPGALSDNSVWADGLLVFYEIFRYLEEAMSRLRHTPIGLLNIEGLDRTEAFEKDLTFYLGNDWKKTYAPRESVVQYLIHLKKLEQSDPNMLMAYIYHLYMGLLSGGQILRKKMTLMQKIPFYGPITEDGNAVTDFGDFPIAKLKRELKDAMNFVADNLDEETKEKLISESKTVFVLNNTIIKSVKRTAAAMIPKLSTINSVVFTKEASDASSLCPIEAFTTPVARTLSIS
uniref:Heme oxygenase n=1 Tax=Timema genevievae TaxID=629358 RepID=A0A7R9PQH9_TIMGE|nr:unnamed protein product [Timema genevievae]